MRRYLLNRIILGFVTIIGVSMIVFVAARMSGDVAVLLAPTNATEEELQVVRERYGLDKPIPIQYIIFIKNAFQGDFGESIAYEQPALEIVFGRIPATMLLGLTGFILGNAFGILIGILSAISRNKFIQWFGRTFALLGQAVPGFWLAVMLVMVFSVNLHWLPTGGIGGIKHLILPAISLSWFSSAFIMRITRSALLDTLNSEYVKMARIKGNPEWIVIGKHALRNALIPVTMLMAMQLAAIIGGSAYIETVFRWPGIGILMVSSIATRDYPLIQAITLVTSTALVTIMILVDILMVFIDPRIKYE